MQPLDEHRDTCPYCGEVIALLLDYSAGEQSYIEDCPVCCRPIVVTLMESADGTIDVSLRHENETD
ncbi:CPXCG motif-containing cysteine-rich protein [Microbulbifer taiwanensis]|uniref:CPXCG motif-containing cysteine-rich protein n=1 Tax=Microbulbifer taiwanensis TaxID=986746 RepID=A0ABW1YPY3_9GAMM|nr:CPXCG motif-containing cysteine-rich protein [Microbulbifer taiwanensis]